MTRLLDVRLALAALVALAGCLPGSGRKNDLSLAAADSVSVRLADAAPVDTLALVRTARMPDDDPLEVPTSLGWLADGRLAVVDTKASRLRLFEADGGVAEATDLPSGAYPYLAGVSGDTVAVLARGLDAVLWAVPGAGVVHEVSVGEGALQGLASSPRAPVWVRRGGGATDDPASVDRIAPDGTVARSAALPVDWRASGYLRAWGDTVVALSGYRPVVDLVTAADADTLALAGFASPQLGRSAQFMRGDADTPPLLTSSAATLGDRLYVLNLRTDHVRIDVYGRDGQLQRALVTPRPWAPLQHVAFDLAVRDADEGAVEIAVLMQRTRGVIQPADAFVALYRWQPATPSGPPAQTEPLAALRPR